jgi:hypothetical protein
VPEVVKMTDQQHDDALHEEMRPAARTLRR